MANPNVDAPASPRLEAVESSVPTVQPSPEPDTSSTTLPGDTMNDDIPMDYPPRSPSPVLPNLRRQAFPPDEASDYGSEDEDDEIAAQLPIYMSTSLFPNINMFQYPLNTRTISTPTWALDRGKYITTRVKENIGRVEVEVPVDAGTTVWREERARELGYVQDVHELNGGMGMNIEGGSRRDKKGGKKTESRDSDDKKRKEKKWGDKMRLRSEVVPNATGYYSGMIHDGALHLHPISRYLQLRTSLQYMDDMKQAEKNDDKALNAQAALANRNVKVDDENDGSGSIKDFRLKMWTMAKKEMEDEWTPYEWKENEDPSVLDKLSTMILPEEKQRRLGCTTKGLDYLDS